MLKHKVKWVNDHIQIYDRLNERVQLMQEYIDSKSQAFDGIDSKQLLLSQIQEQISCYRESIEALDFVSCVTLRRSLETTQSFLEHFLPAFNFRETDRGTEYKRDDAFPLLPKMWTQSTEDRSPDVSETPDDRVLDLRSTE